MGTVRVEFTGGWAQRAAGKICDGEVPGAAGTERRMSRSGNSSDNAALETLWSALMTDPGLDSGIPASRRHTELAVCDDIETFYKPLRRRSSPGGVSPVVFEKQPTLNIKAA